MRLVFCFRATPETLLRFAFDPLADESAAVGHVSNIAFFHLMLAFRTFVSGRGHLNFLSSHYRKDSYLWLISCTASTSAITFSTGVSGKMPWPRLKMCPGRPSACWRI